jgi:uncharacterized protein
MAGELVYFVIPAPDSERARKFYGDLFDWDFEPGNIPDGFQINGAEPPGGLYGGGEGQRPMVYFSVDDIGAAIQRVRDLGGHANDPEDIESGQMAHCRDPKGVEFGIWQGKGGV